MSTTVKNLSPIAIRIPKHRIRPNMEVEVEDRLASHPAVVGLAKMGLIAVTVDGKRLDLVEKKAAKPVVAPATTAEVAAVTHDEAKHRKSKKSAKKGE